VSLAIIVDKEQKRRDIALSCKDIVLSKGLSKVTISELAKAAGVGKGTIYEYFCSKEDIVFEMVAIMLAEYDIEKKQQLENTTSTKEKIEIFFDFFYDSKYIEIRQLYKEFVAISLTNPLDAMTDFLTKCKDDYILWLEEIISEGIENNDINKDAKDMVKVLFIFAEGLFIYSSTTNTPVDIKKELNDYIGLICCNMEIKK
jgi:AcrR family transcriptional regulator